MHTRRARLQGPRGAGPVPVRHVRAGGARRPRAGVLPLRANRSGTRPAPPDRRSTWSVPGRTRRALARRRPHGVGTQGVGRLGQHPGPSPGPAPARPPAARTRSRGRRALAAGSDGRIRRPRGLPRPPFVRGSAAAQARSSRPIRAVPRPPPATRSPGLESRAHALGSVHAPSAVPGHRPPRRPADPALRGAPRSFPSPIPALAGRHLPADPDGAAPYPRRPSPGAAARTAPECHCRRRRQRPLSRRTAPVAYHAATSSSPTRAAGTPKRIPPSKTANTSVGG